MVYDKTDTCYMVLPEYGKQRLLTYAETLDELSGSYLSGRNERDDQSDKRQMLLKQQIHENRSVISGQLATISKLLKNLANEAYCTSGSMEKHKKQIYKILQENGLDIQDLYTVANRNGYLQIGMTMRAHHVNDLYESEDISGFLSKLLHNHMEASPSAPTYIGEDYTKVVFREEVRYFMTNAVAKATKEGEAYSGDNFTMTELADGTYLAAISDGMGSGEAANEDSGMVIELLEQFLEAGFTKEMAAGMLNDLLLARDLEPRTATLDVMECNLYSGEIGFLKLGAAASFLLRDGRAEMFTEHYLPLGLLAGVSGRKNRDTMSSFLRAGDVIVMVSDGITDSIADAAADADASVPIKRLLESYDFVSCKDLANQILKMAILSFQGYIQDDMTVLVMQLQEK